VARPRHTRMNKLLLTAAMMATIVGSAFAQDTVNKDQPPTKTDQATPAATTTTKTYTNFEIGMAFDYPSTWVYVADPKKAKSKSLIPPDLFRKKAKKGPVAPGKQVQDEALFYIPSGAHTSNFEVYSALWDQTPDLWESIQVDANKELKRSVVKQWREEILGVPLLLTKIAYDDAAGHEVGLIGLVYSRTPYKMAFRITAPDENYDAAEYEVRQALLSLRTTQGGLPVPEDPNHPLDKSAYTNVVNRAPAEVVITGHKVDPKKIKKGAVALPLSIADKKVVLTMPEGWTSTVGTDGTVTLHNAAVTGDVMISVASTLDSDPPQAAILKTSAQSLDLFSKVESRNETMEEITTGGASTDTIWRTGTSDKGAITSCDSVGATNDLYWILRYRMDGAMTPAMKKALAELIDGMSVDPAP